MTTSDRDVELEQAEAVVEALMAQPLPVPGGLNCIVRAFTCPGRLVGIENVRVWCSTCGRDYPFVTFKNGIVTIHQQPDHVWR